MRISGILLMKVVLLYEILKMDTIQEKSQYVSWFIEIKSITQTQWNYRSKYQRNLPSGPSIHMWHKIIDRVMVSVGWKVEWTTLNFRRKHRYCKTNLSALSCNVHPSYSQTVTSVTFNSSKTATQELMIVRLQSTTLIDTRGKW